MSRHFLLQHWDSFVIDHYIHHITFYLDGSTSYRVAARCAWLGRVYWCSHLPIKCLLISILFLSHVELILMYLFLIIFLLLCVFWIFGTLWHILCILVYYDVLQLLLWIDISLILYGYICGCFIDARFLFLSDRVWNYVITLIEKRDLGFIGVYCTKFLLFYSLIHWL